MALTNERKAEITALIDEVIGSIRTANTVDELGLALEKFNNSRRNDEKSEEDAEWVIKLFGRKFDELQISEDFSTSRSIVHNMIDSALVGQILMSRFAQLDDLMADPFSEFTDEGEIDY